MRACRNLSILFLCFSCVELYAQPNGKGFSPSELPNDTTKVQYLLDLGYQLETKDPDSAIIVYENAFELSKQLDYTIGAGRSLMYMGIVEADRGNYNEAKHYYEQCLNYFRAINYVKGIGGTLINLGNLAQFRGDFQQAIAWYTEGIPHFEHSKDTSSLILSYNNLGSVFSFLNQPDKSLNYYSQSLLLSEAISDSAGIADSYVNMSKINRQQNNDTAAIENLRKVIFYAPSANSHFYFMLATNNLAELYTTEAGMLDSALVLSKSAVTHAVQVNNPYYTAKAFLTQGLVLNALGRWAEAASALNKGVEIAHSIQSKELLSYGYQLLSKTYLGMKDFKGSLDNLMLHKTYSDSIFNEEQTKSLNELEAKYQSEKKDRELAEQKVELLENEEQLAEQKQFIIISVVIGGISLLIVLFLILYLRERQRSHRQQMLTLERESELQGIKAMMAGEEKERARMAKELHDGLSGLLGTIKLRFSAFQETLTANHQNHPFSEALDLLDEANSEVRRISHNLMPELLLKYGLIEGLQNYFNNINASATLSIELQSYGINGRLPSSLELTVYRIIQELINNIIKHSDARDALVQLTIHENLLTITVEDNGKGFAPELAKNGAGLESIKSRVEYLHGKVNIKSDGASGTSVYIELILDKTNKA